MPKLGLKFTYEVLSSEQLEKIYAEEDLEDLNVDRFK